MKTITLNLYSFAELSPEAQRRAVEIERERRRVMRGELLDDVSDEMSEAVEIICDRCDLISMNIRIDAFDEDTDAEVVGEAMDIDGDTALEWFLGVLIQNGYSRPEAYDEMKFDGVCGFDGKPYADKAAEAIWKALLDGRSVQCGFQDVAELFWGILTDKWVTRLSDAGISSDLAITDEIFTVEGRKFTP